MVMIDVDGHSNVNNCVDMPMRMKRLESRMVNHMTFDVVVMMMANLLLLGVAAAHPPLGAQLIRIQVLKQSSVFCIRHNRSDGHSGTYKKFKNFLLQKSTTVP